MIGIPLNSALFRNGAAHKMLTLFGEYAGPVSIQTDKLFQNIIDNWPSISPPSSEEQELYDDTDVKTCISSYLESILSADPIIVAHFFKIIILLSLNKILFSDSSFSDYLLNWLISNYSSIPQQAKRESLILIQNIVLSIPNAQVNDYVSHDIQNNFFVLIGDGFDDAVFSVLMSLVAKSSMLPLSSFFDQYISSIPKTPPESHYFSLHLLLKIISKDKALIPILISSPLFNVILSKISEGTPLRIVKLSLRILCRVCLEAPSSDKPPFDISLIRPFFSPDCPILKDLLTFLVVYIRFEIAPFFESDLLVVLLHSIPEMSYSNQQLSLQVISACTSCCNHEQARFLFDNDTLPLLLDILDTDDNEEILSLFDALDNLWAALDEVDRTNEFYDQAVECDFFSRIEDLNVSTKCQERAEMFSDLLSKYDKDISYE